MRSFETVKEGQEKIEYSKVVTTFNFNFRTSLSTSPASTASWFQFHQSFTLKTVLKARPFYQFKKLCFNFKMVKLFWFGNHDNAVKLSSSQDALRWSGRGEFVKSKRKDFWVWNGETERGELAGYINEGGGLTFALVKFCVIFL